MQPGIAGSRVFQTFPAGSKLIQGVHPLREHPAKQWNPSPNPRTSPNLSTPFPNAIPLGFGGLQLDREGVAVSRYPNSTVLNVRPNAAKTPWNLSAACNSRRF